MVITDLDGTLLNSNLRVSETDINTLHRLGELKIKRVIATGRSYFSLQRVIPHGFPLDYLISSSGAGIIEWKSKNIIHSETIPPEQVQYLSGQFVSRELDFMIQEPLPDNHRFTYYHSGRANPDFFRRIEYYQDYAVPLDISGLTDLSASLLIVVTPPGVDIYTTLKIDFPRFNVVRTTSPLDHESMWIEFFPLTVSKSMAAEHLCEITGCASANVMAIGNDYNDLDLLQWSPTSFIVSNAPKDMRQRFRNVASHEDSGFSDAVGQSVNIYN